MAINFEPLFQTFFLYNKSETVPEFFILGVT